MVKKKSDFAFKKGWLQVPLGLAPKVKKEIWDALGINNRTTWCTRVSGAVEPKVSEAHAIEGIFRKYGIKDIWGV